MKLKILLLMVCCAALVFAQQSMNVEQLAGFIRSEIALQQHSDKQIAAYLRKIHLTEKLSSKTIDDLEAQGAGPKTVDALKELQTQSASLKPPATDPTSSPDTSQGGGNVAPASTLSSAQRVTYPPPNPEQEKAILDRMRDYALNYTQGLPNFICVQVTRQYIQPFKGYGTGSEHTVGNVMARLTWVQGHENYHVFSVNGKYEDRASLSGVGPTSSEGEFGSLLKQLFAPETEAVFTFHHWGRLRGRALAVFQTDIDSSHTKETLTYFYGEKDHQQIIMPYTAYVYVDPQTGEIDRIRIDAVNIPSYFPIKKCTEILDYDMTEIGTQRYLVPLVANLWLQTDEAKAHNTIEFRDYRRFASDVDIQYDTAALQKPIAADKTEEQPVDKKDNKPATPAPDNSNDPWSIPTLPPPPPKPQ